MLSSSITAAAGKVVVLALSTPFDMTGFQSGSCIEMHTTHKCTCTSSNPAAPPSWCEVNCPCPGSLPPCKCVLPPPWANTSITIVGNAAVFDAGGKGRFFIVGDAVALVMSNVTLQNGVSESSPCTTKQACV
jgi:hypothetical protein